MQLGEFGEDGGSTEAGDDVRDVTDAGIRRDAAEAVRASALHGQRERGKRRGGSFDLIRLRKCREGLVDGLLHQGGLEAGLLLIDENDGLAQLGIAGAELLHKQSGLRVLATEAEHSGAGDIGVMNVAGEQTAKLACILPRTAATQLMSDKADAIDVGKDAFRARGVRRRGSAGVELLRDEPAHALAIGGVGAAVTEFFFESFFQLLDVAVLTEDERKNDPVIACAYLAIGAVVAHEGAAGPGRGIGQGIGNGVASGGVSAGAMLDVLRGEQGAATDGLDGFTDNHAIHADEIAGGEIDESHFVLGGDGLRDDAGKVGGWAELDFGSEIECSKRN